MDTDTIRMDILAEAARARAAAAHGECGAIVARTAALLNLSPGRTHSLISRVGQQLGLLEARQRRSDAGASALSEADLQLIAGAMTHSQRAGKWMLSCQDALDMLHEAGQLPARLSASHVNRLLRARGLHPEQLVAPAPATPLRTRHVNAVWQIDASVCVLYRTPKGELALLEEGGVHYKNKLHNYTRVMNDLLVRYVGTEHASGAVGVRFYAGGETTANALDFLMWLMVQRQDASGAPMPFHGVPFLLYTDQGSAFRAAPFRNFCGAMDIRLEHHAPRNSRATGQVENAQKLVEHGLESRLRFLDRADISIARLNALGELWMHAFNGTRTHSRHGLTRYAAWSLIDAQHLRLAPALEVMRTLPASLAEKRQVSANKTVSFALKGQGSRDYDLRWVPGVSVKDRVLVTVNPFDAPKVRVGVEDRDSGEITWHTVEPIERDRFGYDVAAPVLGEDYRAQPATPADQQRQAIAAQAFASADGEPASAEQVRTAQRAGAAPYRGQFDPFADFKAQAAALPTFLQRPGQVHEVAAPQVAAVRLSVAEACKRIRLGLGEHYDPGTYAWLSERYGSEGVPEEVIKGLLARREIEPAPPASGGLRAVGGTAP